MLPAMPGFVEFVKRLSRDFGVEEQIRAYRSKERNQNSIKGQPIMVNQCHLKVVGD